MNNAARGARAVRMLSEGVLIVASILLALGVQAWWEGLQEHRLEVEYLAALRGELEAALDQQLRTRGTLEGAMDAHEALLGEFGKPDHSPTDSLYLRLALLSLPVGFDPPSAVLADLVSSGGVQLIEADDLRLAIADYSRTLERIERTTEQAWATWSERIQPFLESQVPRVDRLRFGAASFDVTLQASPFPSNFDAIFEDAGFESMVAERWFRLERAGRAVDQVEAAIKDLIAMIDRELNEL